MRPTCGAVVVLFLIKLAGAIPGEPVMYLPPFEVRTLDAGTRMFPISSVPFIHANQRMMSQPAMSMQQSPISAQQSPMSTIQQSPMAVHQQSMVSAQQQSPMSAMQQSPMSVQQQSMISAQQQSPMSAMQQSPMSVQQQSMMSAQQQPMMPMQQSIHTIQSQPSVLHTSLVSPPSSEEPIAMKPHNRHNFTLHEFVEVLNEMTEHNNEERPEAHSMEENSFSRAAEERDGYPAPSPPPPYPPYSLGPAYPRPYSPARPSYPSYPQQPTSYVSPLPHQASKSVDLTDLLKPASTKVASKVSGLIGLILTLLTGSAPGDLELTGFKDIVINGIVKPLLIAKGGIKSLISKLAIPVISLLLINVEVLITVWWLWEECPKEAYSKPSYNYNSYPSSYHPPPPSSY